MVRCPEWSTGITRGYVLCAAGLLSWLLGGAAVLRAELILVSPAVSVMEDGACSLPEAIENANDLVTGQVHADCAPGDPGGQDTLVLASGASYVFNDVTPPIPDNSFLPLIETVIVIQGNGASLERGGEPGCSGGTDAPGSRFFSVSETGELTLRQLTVKAGCVPSEDNGGCIKNLGTLRVEDSRVTMCSGFLGGGIFNEGRLEVRRSAFLENGAVVGGAVYNRGHATLINSTLSRNKSPFPGGAVSNQGELELVHCTFAENANAFFGDDVATFSGRVTFKGCILASVATTPCFDNEGGALFAVGENLTEVSASCPGFTLQGVDVGLEPLADNGGFSETHALLAESPAIDLMSTCTDLEGELLTRDQRRSDRPRPGRGRCDAGAFEVADLPVLEVPTLGSVGWVLLSFGLALAGSFLLLSRH